MSQKDRNAWGPIDPAERLLDAFLKYELSYPVLSWEREKMQSQFLHLTEGLEGGRTGQRISPWVWITFLGCGLR